MFYDVFVRGGAEISNI